MNGRQEFRTGAKHKAMGVLRGRARSPSQSPCARVSRAGDSYQEGVLARKCETPGRIVFLNSESCLSSVNKLCL